MNERLAKLGIKVTRTYGDTVRLSDAWMGPLGRHRVSEVMRALDHADACGQNAAHKYAVFHGAIAPN